MFRKTQRWTPPVEYQTSKQQDNKNLNHVFQNLPQTTKITKNGLKNTQDRKYQITAQYSNAREIIFNQTKHSMLTRTVECQSRYRFRRENEKHEKHCLRVQTTKMCDDIDVWEFPMVSP